MMNENELQKIVDAVTERLRAEFSLLPKVKPAEPEPERVPFFCEKCKATGLWTRREIEVHQRSHDEPSELEATIGRLAAEREAAFRPSAGDKANYRLCVKCHREFFSIGTFNNHACVQAGTVTPTVLFDPTRPGQAERSAAAMQAENRRTILAEAQEAMNKKRGGK